jgi:hypothetical protein
MLAAARGAEPAQKSAHVNADLSDSMKFRNK